VDIEADERCEMCGALRFGDEVDTKASHDAVEMLRRLADIWLQDPIALGVVLVRVAMPTATYREIGRIVGRSNPVVIEHIKHIKSSYPQIGAFAESKNQYAQARKRE